MLTDMKLRIAGEPLRRRSARQAEERARERRMERLYRAHWKDLCHFIRWKFGGGPPDPEDIAQAAFLRLATLPEPESIQNPFAFLGRVASNLVLDDIRRTQVRTNSMRELGLAADGERDDRPGCERELIGREDMALVIEELKAMPSVRRRVLILNRVHGLSFAEIGRRMGISGPAVRKHLVRALQDLQAAIEDEREERDSAG
jgi:RNA polymerase sigma-70 factor (ECF subfamily)